MAETLYVNLSDPIFESRLELHDLDRVKHCTFRQDGFAVDTEVMPNGASAVKALVLKKGIAGWSEYYPSAKQHDCTTNHVMTSL